MNQIVRPPGKSLFCKNVYIRHSVYLTAIRLLRMKICSYICRVRNKMMKMVIPSFSCIIWRIHQVVSANVRHVMFFLLVILRAKQEKKTPKTVTNLKESYITY